MHCTECSHTDFQREVLESLTELKTNMHTLIGNGQPGRVGNLEKRMSNVEMLVYKMIGGLVLAGALFGIVKMVWK